MEKDIIIFASLPLGNSDKYSTIYINTWRSLYCITIFYKITLKEFVFLNAILILQPMDKKVISNLKQLSAKHLFRSWFDVAESAIFTLWEFCMDIHDVPQNYRYGLLNFYKEDLEFCVEEAVAWDCVWNGLWNTWTPRGISDENCIPLHIHWPGHACRWYHWVQ